MEKQDETKYEVKFSQSLPNEYIEGFCDGFKAAWIECWDYMLKEINAMKSKQEPSSEVGGE